VPIYALGEYEPEIHPTAFVHPEAIVIGRVTIGPEASVWPCAVLRGDHGRIEVGARTSVQDGTVVHCTREWPTLIGADCVVGHNAHLEGCVVGDRCLIGSGSVTLNRVVVGAGSIVAAACLVPEGFEVPPGALVAGVPAKIKRTGLEAGFTDNPVKTYIETARTHRSSLRRLDIPTNPASSTSPTSSNDPTSPSNPTNPTSPSNPTNPTNLGGLGWPSGFDVPGGISHLSEPLGDSRPGDSA
jgi:carbonic anhydrase/acetyltransferase-like protein (isoleucine patch superfamily)